MDPTRQHPKDSINTIPESEEYHFSSAQTDYAIASVEIDTTADVAFVTQHKNIVGASLASQEFIIDENNRTVSIGPNASSSSSMALFNNKHGSAILLSGTKGTGKSTFMENVICNRFGTFFSILLLNKPDSDKICTIEKLNDLLKLTKCIEDYSLENASGHKWLIVLALHRCVSDFLEKLSPNSIIRALLNKKVLPDATMLILCNPCQVDELMSIAKIRHHYNLQGFSKQGMIKYITTRRASDNRQRPLLGSDHSSLSCLQQNQLGDVKNPLACLILVEAIGSITIQTPKTMTDLVYKLVCGLIEHALDADERAALHDGKLRLEKLPETVEAAFEANCSLAMEHLLIGCKCASYEESSQFFSSFCLKLSKLSRNDCFRFGLVDLATGSTFHCNAYQFIHPLVTEFLAGFYLRKLPPVNQLTFLFKNSLKLFENGYTHWLTFFFGLTSDIYTSSQTAFVNPTKLMMNSVVDVLVDSLKLNTNSKYRCALIRSLNEAQEKSIFRKLSSKHSLVLTFSMSIGIFDSCVDSVVSIISNSGMANWIITTSPRNKQLALTLKAKVESVSIVVIYDDSVIDRLDITPKRNSAELDRLYRESDQTSERTPQESMEKLNQLVCRAVREILQRVFPLYSAVKLKGDSSNVSYVSFLTCECFKESFSKCVQLYPLIPIHYLDGPKKNTSNVPLESMSMSDRHNAEKHNGGTVEVVLMLRPLPERIKGVVPLTNEKFNLILSNDLSVEFYQENSSANANFSKIEECVATVRCMDNFDATRDNTQMILPSLQVVPKMLTGRAQHALPKPFVHPAEVPRVDSILPEGLSNTLQEGSQRSDSIQTPGVANLNMGSVDHQLLPSVSPYGHVPMNPYHSLAQTGGATSIQPSHGAFVHTFTAEQAVGEAQQSSRRQANLRQGTVLYTSVPDKIPSDRIQPLPTQHTLIRKGGNGSIFSENVNGLALAVKKTSYRSKEYAIITKIRHKNIVPLLAYVWGEEHKESKRRFFVYHYLPKLSGDMARLVTDKEELSLHDFHKRHHNNPRAMGVAVGNVKYILSQVLEGLHYLHDNHRCIHRDVKASNVLIKFFCNCDNPVQCSCDVKYQVVICDFDAALELDSSSRIPPTTTHSSRSQAKQYEIVPVGTNGFRSPESSMLMIANSPDAFSPPLSTKADIYSFGILSMRLMMSTDTPYSQRAMSTLLLYYHQSLGVSEGRLKSPSVWRVEESTVLKLLKLHKLNARMRWLRGAYEFASKCLLVNPEERPSASSLLKDPFLN
ncbi:uncharacterized protein LOC135347510 isoform X2 [Halichondria panicea]